MLFFSRSRVRSFLSFVVFAMLVSLLLRGQSAYAASVVFNRPFMTGKGRAIKVGVVNPRMLSTGKVLAAGPDKYVRFPHLTYTGRSDTTSVSLPRNVALPYLKQPGPDTLGRPLQNFNGVSSNDSVRATGFQVEPPDQGLCVSGKFVVEQVNWVMTVYSHDGKGHVVLGPVSLWKFFLESPSSKELISDPECYFDSATNTWFAIVTASNFTQESHLDIGVNPSGDPTTPWTIYHLDTTGTTNCPCVSDEPRLGIDPFNLYIGTDQFNLAKGNFVGAQIYALSKPQLVALAKVNYTFFFNLTIANGPAFAVQPAISVGNASAEYFLSSFMSSSGDNRLGVWALTNQQAVTNGGMLTLSNIVVSTEGYAQPPPAEDPNSDLLSTDDDRMQQVQFINGEIWGALSTGISFKGDTAVRSGVAWFIMDPSLSSDGTIQGATVRDQSYYGILGNYVLYPTIEASPKGAAVMVMTLSGAHIAPSAMYAVRSAAKQGQFNTLSTPGLGKNGYNCFAPSNGVCRWGDYSAAMIDPSNGGATAWIATEYIPDKGSEVPNWGTDIVEVQMA